ncbi:hypothetical protein D3C86_1688540 [compost metagenome]
MRFRLSHRDKRGGGQEQLLLQGQKPRSDDAHQCGRKGHGEPYGHGEVQPQKQQSISHGGLHFRRESRRYEAARGRSLDVGPGDREEESR